MTPQTIQITNEAGEVKNFTEEEYFKERDRLLVLWQSAKLALDVAKENEIMLRTEAALFMHDPNKAGSVETVELGQGYKAKVKVPVNYGFIKNESGKIDKARIEKALSKIEKDGAVGELIAERLIDWKPNLSLSEYKLLSEKHRKIIDDVVVTTTGTATLSIAEPKAKK